MEHHGQGQPDGPVWMSRARRARASRTSIASGGGRTKSRSRRADPRDGRWDHWLRAQMGAGTARLSRSRASLIFKRELNPQE